MVRGIQVGSSRRQFAGNSPETIRNNKGKGLVIRKSYFENENKKRLFIRTIRMAAIRNS